MEKIDSFAVIDPSRRLHECYICEKNQGAPITCDNKRCITAFHPSCGRRANLYLKLVENPGGVELSAFCHKHTPSDHKHKVETLEENIATIQQETRNDVEATENETVVRTVQGHHVKEMLDTSDDILDKVDTLETLKGYYVKEKENIVNDIAHYWLQKRKDNRDVPLITRLRIEVSFINILINIKGTYHHLSVSLGLVIIQNWMVIRVRKSKQVFMYTR
jgi:hypothetical protein